MLAVMPFICLAIGIFAGFRMSGENASKMVDWILNVALVIMILTIGVKIGCDESLFSSLALLGFHCVIIAFLAMGGSILCVVFTEKTILPLKQMKEKLAAENMDSQNIAGESDNKDQGSALVWVIPLSMVAGIAMGYFLVPASASDSLDHVITVALAVLFIGVGISFGLSSWVFQYIKILGWKIFILPVAITLGSMAGGFVAGLFLNIPMVTSIGSSAGMGYYSLTGAILTQNVSTLSGTYGFLVNVLREFLSVSLLPLFIKISLGSPIASAGATNMDTLLVPVTKFVGVELGVVAFFTGTVLTFVVPVAVNLIAAIL